VIRLFSTSGISFLLSHAAKIFTGLAFTLYSVGLRQTTQSKCYTTVEVKGGKKEPPLNYAYLNIHKWGDIDIGPTIPAGTSAVATRVDIFDFSVQPKGYRVCHKSGVTVERQA
jgi:hypothetical protein